MYKKRFLIYTIIALFLAFLVFNFFLTFWFGSQDDYEMESKFNKINNIYSTIDNKVYASVPSNGNYLVEGASAQTFKALENRNDAHIGFDEHKVYAGNMILKDLNPNTLLALGNNYYTDGNITYYCSEISDRNPKMNALEFVIKAIGFKFGWNQKPKNYWYPQEKLPNGVQYKKHANYGIAISSQKAYYEGKEMLNAFPDKITPLVTLYSDGDKRESNLYYTDGKHLYYENKLLDIEANPNWIQLEMAGHSLYDNHYIIDTLKGNVVVDGKIFNTSKAPYHLLGKDFNNSHHVFFADKNNIYYYDYYDEKVKEAGSNIFENNTFKILNNDIIISNNKIYFYNSEEIWRRKHGLKSKVSNISILKNVPADQLKLIGNIANNKESIWKYNNRYFILGLDVESSKTKSAIYEINSEAKALQLLSVERLRYDDINQLINNEDIFIPENKNEISVKGDFPDDTLKYIIYIFGSAFLVVMILKYLFRNKVFNPFEIIDNNLILTNLRFKKYPIHEIKKIYFYIQKSTIYGLKGFTGFMKIEMKNGKMSNKIMFLPKFTILPQSEEDTLSHINDLQIILNNHGISSELKEHYAVI